MHPSRQRIFYLVTRYFQQTNTEVEYEELMKWIAECADEELLTEILQEAWELQEEEIQKELNALKRDKIPQEILKETRVVGVGLPYIHDKKDWTKNILKYAAIFLLLGVAFYLFKTEPDPKNPTTEQPETGKVRSNDILPGRLKATLTLPKGQAIILTDQLQDRLDSRGQVKMTHAGELEYRADSGEEMTDEQHILSVPRGGEYRLILPDGTRVWLNSDSEIRYPVVFGATERIVNVRGEVYFEVAKDSKRPFIVGVANTRIEVLGTAFNVSAYSDDRQISTTLVEGAIRVEHGKQHNVLVPGERASVLQNGGLLVEKVDIHRDIAWKNGLFYFEDAPIEEIMGQVSRWYDINVTYEHMPKRRLTGKFPRTVTLARFLEILEFAGIHFELHGNHMIIKG